MQAVEALTRLIQSGDREIATHRSAMAQEDQGPFEEVHNQVIEEVGLAVSVASAMLNTALPVARFRAFVEIDPTQPKRSAFQESVAVYHEFTVCSVDMRGILSGLIGITHVPTNVKVSVWEQRATGADMISGYQGQTKTPNYRMFLKALPALEAMPSVN